MNVNLNIRWVGRLNLNIAIRNEKKVQKPDYETSAKFE